MNMLRKIVYKIFGSKNDRVIKKYRTIIKKIHEFSAHYSSLSDDALSAITEQLRARVALGATLDDVLPEAFAVVREAAHRSIGQTHYDVQLLGGIALHHGHIAEMSTGEGKTLTATLTAYLNTLDGKSVHIITANPYLAQRDAAWMGRIFTRLNITVGHVIPGQTHQEKHSAYAHNIIYATHYEIGYDYLRDNMVTHPTDKVIHHGLHYAIIDEADSILIDEARTPLIISGSIEESSGLYPKLLPIIQGLTLGEEGHLILDEKERSVTLTEQGIDLVEERMRTSNLLDGSLYDAANVSLLHYLDASLRAAYLFKVNVDYLVHQGSIIIIDESTGRPLAGRRWSQGLHQAIEAKENVAIQAESQTLASITLQNFFRLYKKLSGMTGTASTEAEELREIYNLDVVTIPTHRPMVRIDSPDLVFLTVEEKIAAIMQDVQERHARGQPILIGSPSVESSEVLSQRLHDCGIQHTVLSAKHHDQEAKIIAQAGCYKAVTISANMAGRGTDIILGGDMSSMTPEGSQISYEEWQTMHEKVVSLGGLHVIGTERNESRRVDHQIRGRSGRQGDPGSSQFYLSLEDPLIRIFASDRVAHIMRMLGMKKDEAIQSPILDRAISNAQHKVEQYHYDVRKNLLKYDDIANDQRQLIYNERNILMDPTHIEDTLHSVIDQVLSSWIQRTIPESAHLPWNIESLEHHLQKWDIKTDITSWIAEQPHPDSEKLRNHLHDIVYARLRLLSAHVPDDIRLQAWSTVMLETIDQLWKDHLAITDHLRAGIHLRSYAQKNPAHEFTTECFELFYTMLAHLKEEITRRIMHLHFKAKPPEHKVGSYRVSNHKL